MPSGEGGKRIQEKREEGESSRRGKAPEPLTGVLNTITTTSGSSVRKRKTREITSIGYGPPINKIKRADGSEVCFPHNDPLVITPCIRIMDVKRVLCDVSSNTNDLFAATFKRMKLKESKLVLVRTMMYRVGTEELPVLGCIELLVMFMGTGPNDELCYTSKMVKWLVVDVPSAYNANIRRSTHGSVHMHTDIKYLTMLFETEEGDAIIFVN